MRLSARLAAAVTLAVALTTVAVPPAAAGHDADHAVLAPVESYRKAYAWPGGDTASHVLLNHPGTHVSTLYPTGGGDPVDVATDIEGGNGGVYLPRLVGTTSVAIPTDGGSFHSPVSVRFQSLASGEETSTFAVDTAVGERVWAYPAPDTLLVGKPDAVDHTRTDLYLRTVAGETKVMDDADLNAHGAHVLADAVGAVVYDGGRLIRYLDFATQAVTRVDDVDSFADVVARPTYLTPTEVGYRNSGELVRVPRGGTTRTRIAYAGRADVVRHVGSRLVLTRYRHPARYELVAIPEDGGEPTVLPVELTDNSLGTPGGSEVAAFGIVADGASGRIAVDVTTGAARMLVPLLAPRASVVSVALTGGRVVVADEASIGNRLTQASVDPVAAAPAFGARTELAGDGWSDYCNGLLCSPVAAAGTRTAFVQSAGGARDLVVLDGATEVVRKRLSHFGEGFELGADHLLYRVYGTRYLLDLRTGAETTTSLNDVWGGFGYGVDSGAVVRRDLDSGTVDVAHAADDCSVDAQSVTGRAQWVGWVESCPGEQQMVRRVRNLATGALTTVPLWAHALGDGIAVGLDGAALTSFDLVTGGNPTTVVTTFEMPYDPSHNWDVDETGGRLVAWRDDTDETVHVRRLASPVLSPPVLVSAAAPGRVTSGTTWQPRFDYSGNGVDWTLTVAPGTAHAVRRSGSAPDGAVRPSLPIALDPGAYPYVLSVTARDGSAAPADVTGELQVAGPTALALSAPARVTYGSAASLAATLTSGGTPVAGATVTFETRRVGGATWTAVGSRPTGATGATAALSHQPAAHAEYRATFAATDTYDGAQATRTVAVAVKVGASVTPAKALNGTTVTIRGTVAPAHGGAVTLQRYTATGWANALSGTLNAGAFSFAVRPAATGVHKYRVVRAADADHAGGTSATVTYTAYRVAIASISAAGEYAVLKNTGSTPVNLSGWLIDAGASTERFRLPSYALAAGRSVRVYTGHGTNAAGALYLRRAGGIWAARDVGRLYDPRGALSSRLAY